MDCLALSNTATAVLIRPTHDQLEVILFGRENLRSLRGSTSNAILYMLLVMDREMFSCQLPQPWRIFWGNAVAHSVSQSRQLPMMAVVMPSIQYSK